MHKSDKSIDIIVRVLGTPKIALNASIAFSFQRHPLSISKEVPALMALQPFQREALGSSLSKQQICEIE